MHNPDIDLPELLGRAHGVRYHKAPKKLDIYLSLLGAIKAGQLTYDNLNQPELEQLLAYFQPPTPRKPKTFHEWVALALPDKKEIRYYLHHMYSNGKHLIATDGHRMHVAFDVDLAEGFYTNTLEPVTVDGKFPDWERVLVKNIGRTEELKLDGLKVQQGVSNKKNFHAFLLPVADDSECAVDQDYVKQAATMDAPEYTIDRKPDEALGIFGMIDVYEVAATIMPLRI
jgi:hypothetical protein